MILEVLFIDIKCLEVYTGKKYETHHKDSIFGWVLCQKGRLNVVSGWRDLNHVCLSCGHAILIDL